MVGVYRRSSRMPAGSTSARCPTGATGASRWRQGETAEIFTDIEVEDQEVPAHAGIHGILPDAACFLGNAHFLSPDMGELGRCTDSLCDIFAGGDPVCGGHSNVYCGGGTATAADQPAQTQALPCPNVVGETMTRPMPAIPRSILPRFKTDVEDCLPGVR